MDVSVKSQTSPKVARKPPETRWPYLFALAVPILLAVAGLPKQTDLLSKQLSSFLSFHSRIGSGTSDQSSLSSVNFEDMRAQYSISCPKHDFQTRIFSTDPLIIYLENFIGKDEARYILNVA